MVVAAALERDYRTDRIQPNHTERSMGLFGNIGKKVFGGGGIDENAVREKLAGLGLNVKSLSVVAFQNEKKVAVTGRVASEADRARLIEVARTCDGVESVDDRIQVAPPEPARQPDPAPDASAESEPKSESSAAAEASDATGETTYTVQSGDTLGAIAKQHYGDASKYMRIFKANQPPLEDPNKIYPGQVLRIPPAD